MTNRISHLFDVQWYTLLDKIGCEDIEEAINRDIEQELSYGDED